MIDSIFIEDNEAFYICIEYPNLRQYFKCWFRGEILFRQHIGGSLDKQIVVLDVNLFKLLVTNGFIEFVDENMNNFTGKEVSLKSYLRNK
ncbi:MAG: hypothetical protein OEV44_15105 [Spirochaetota bacterium]|nr:hypothetical protein [Spirochaetota bacterium]